MKGCRPSYAYLAPFRWDVDLGIYDRKEVMATLTERVRVSLPVEVKVRLQELADQRGLSLSALMREVTSELIFRDYVRLSGARVKRNVAAHL